MPVFEIQGPDGKTYEIDAPDQETALRAFAQTNRPQSSQAADILKSGGAGLAEGAISVPGIVSDVQSLLHSGLDQTMGRGFAYMTGQPFEEFLQDQTEARQNLPSSYLTSGALKKGIESLTGEFHKPETTAGEYARTIGQFAPGALTGGGGLAPRLLSTGGAALASEAAGQATQDTELEPYARVVAAILGAGAGNVAGNLASAKPIPGQTRASTSLLRRAAPDSADDLAKLGPDAMLLDASPSMTGLAQGASVSPTKSRNAIVDALRTRQEGRSARLLSDAQNTLGKARDPELLKRALGEAASRSSGPIYEKAFSGAPVLAGSLDDTLAVQLTAPAEAMGPNGRKVMLGVMDQIDDALKSGTPELTARRLMNIRQTLDSQIVYDIDAVNALSSADKAAQRPLKQARAAVDDILKNRIPGIADADKIVSAAKKAQGDVDYGFSSLEGGKYAKTPERFSKDMLRRDNTFVGEGMKADIHTAMGTQANDLSALRKKIGGDFDFNRDKLAKVFGKEKVDKLISAIGREEQFAQSYADVARNSQTAMRSASAKAVEGPDAFHVSDSASLIGLGGKGAAKLVNALLAKGVTKYSSRNAEALVKALTAKGPDAEKLLADIVQGGLTSKTRLIQALFAATIPERQINPPNR